MRASTFAEYLNARNHRSKELTVGPFLGVEPDGFFGETSQSEPAWSGREDEEGDDALSGTGRNYAH